MTMKPLLFATSLLGTLASNAAAAQDDAASLAIDVINIKGNDGRIIIAVHADAASYNTLDDSAAYAAIVLQPNGNSARVELGKIPTGFYAVTLFHDANGNGEFDFDGDIPLEGYGISGAKHALDEPNFRQARLEVKPGEQAVTVKMNYFKL